MKKKQLVARSNNNAKARAKKYTPRHVQGKALTLEEFKPRILEVIRSFILVKRALPEDTDIAAAIPKIIKLDDVYSGKTKMPVMSQDNIDSIEAWADLTITMSEIGLLLSEKAALLSSAEEKKTNVGTIGHLYEDVIVDDNAAEQPIEDLADTEKEHIIEVGETNV